MDRDSDSAPSIYWEAFDRDESRIRSDWQWAAAIIAITLGILAIMLGNLLFGVVILLGTSVAALLAVHPPRIVRFAILPRGISVDNNIYSYGALESFWIDENRTDHPVLILKAKKKWVPYLVMPLIDVNVDVVHALLTEKLLEEELEEPLAHRLVEFFGF